MSKDVHTSPILMKYLEAYKKNPHGRVFAPLAEAYRKLGRVEKSLEILKAGLKIHPTYVMGYLGLAACYHDINQHSLAYATLRPLVAENRDNLLLQKLFGQICLEMGLFEEALETYKYLLFINPKDKDVAHQVAQLENNHAAPVFQEDDSENLFGVQELKHTPFEEGDDWVHMDLTNPSSNFKEEALEQLDEITLEESAHLSSNIEEEVVEDISIPMSEQKAEKEIDNIDLSETEVNQDQDLDKPLMTHTLVDLYCRQGLYLKAEEILKCILLQNPNDIRTIQRLNEIEVSINKYGNSTTEKNEGREDLMSIFDKKVLGVNAIEDIESNKPDKYLQIEAVYLNYLDILKSRFSQLR